MANIISASDQILKKLILKKLSEVTIDNFIPFREGSPGVRYIFDEDGMHEAQSRVMRKLNENRSAILILK